MDPTPPRGARASASPRAEPRGSAGGSGRSFASTDRRRMLDLRREGHFKYDLRDILAKSSLPPEQAAAFAATVFSKGSRQSTGEAKDWVTAKLHEDLITRAERDAINTLLDRYSKWR